MVAINGAMRKGKNLLGHRLSTPGETRTEEMPIEPVRNRRKAA